MANSPLFAKPSPLYFLQWFFGHLVFYLFGPLESVYHTSSVKSRFGIKNYFCHPNPVYTGCLLLSHLWVVMCCPLTKRLKVEFLRTCLFSTTMMWCHSPSLIKSGNQTRAPKSPVKSGCQSLLLLIGAKEISVFWKKSISLLWGYFIRLNSVDTHSPHPITRNIRIRTWILLDHLLEFYMPLVAR